MGRSVQDSAEETQIEASFCEAIRIAREQKSISMAKRVEGTYAEYRRQKASTPGGGGIPTTCLVKFVTVSELIAMNHPKPPSPPTAVSRTSEK